MKRVVTQAEVTAALRAQGRRIWTGHRRRAMKRRILFLAKLPAVALP